MGLVTLVGLIAKNGILVVEFANKLQEEGRSKLDAVHEAAMTRLRETRAGQVEALELVLTTPEHERGGQFVITPEIAAQLMSKEVDLPTFFLAHVQF